MRCWQCRKLIVVPDSTQSDDSLDKIKATMSMTVGCNCGAAYWIHITRMQDRRRVQPVEQDTEKSRLWGNRD